MSQNIEETLRSLRQVREELKKAAFLPLPPDQAAMMQQQGGMPPGGMPPQGMPPQGGMPMDPAMAGGGMPPGGMPMNPAMAGGGMPPQDPGAAGGPDLGMAIEQILAALQEMMQINQEFAQRIEALDQQTAQLTQQVEGIVQALQEPAPMDGAVR